MPHEAAPLTQWWLRLIGQLAPAPSEQQEEVCPAISAAPNGSSIVAIKITMAMRIVSQSSTVALWPHHYFKSVDSDKSVDMESGERRAASGLIFAVNCRLSTVHDSGSAR